MRTTTATLLLLTAIGCGGARENSRASTTSPEPAAEATTPVAATAPESPEATQPVAEPASAPQEGAATATPAAATMAGTAKAELKMVSGDKSLGTMTFERKDKVIAISGQFSGLKKGQHALYIHTKGDCSDKAKNVGAHLNPTKSKHGPPASPMRHAGDFGDLTFDKDGNATFAMETDSVTMEPGRADSVVGRAVVVYSKKDSKSGKAGSPVACGVIALDGGSSEAPSERSSYTAPAATPTAASK